jgi:YfiH family protein
MQLPEIQLPEIQEIDALFERAGLRRNLRGKAAGVTLRMRFKRAAREELMPASPIPRVAPNGVEWLAVSEWAKAGRKENNWLWHGFSTRRGGLSHAYCAEDAPGELNLGFTAADERETVFQNRRLLAEAVSGDAATPLVTLRQIHSNVVVLAGSEEASRERPRKGGVPSDRSSSLGCKAGVPSDRSSSLGWKAGVPSDRSSSLGWKAGVPSDRSSSLGCKADGLMTDTPGVLLGIQTADCIPVLVADRKRRAVAAFHAGWRGTVKRIVETGIGRMRLAFGSRPEDLIAAIGPGIGACCYAVGEEVLSEFESQFSYARELFREVYDSDPVRTRYPMLFLTQRAPGHSLIGPSLHVDLVEASRRQLLAAGLKPRSIQWVGGCTSCQRELFFSHRGSQGHAGRMLSVIGIRPDAG